MSVTTAALDLRVRRDVRVVRERADLEAAIRRHPAGRRRPMSADPWPGGQVRELGRPGSRPSPAATGRPGRSVRVRLAIVALATIGLLLVNWWLSSSAGAASMHPDRPAHTVTVLPGDTLWAIALATAPQEDPRATILAIREANGLSGSGLQVGQRLVIPASVG